MNTNGKFKSQLLDEYGGDSSLATDLNCYLEPALQNYKALWLNTPVDGHEFAVLRRVTAISYEDETNGTNWSTFDALALSDLVARARLDGLHLRKLVNEWVREHELTPLDYLLAVQLGADALVGESLEIQIRKEIEQFEAKK